LTFFPKDQWRMNHAMPRSKTPCGARYSLICRYITDALVKKGSLDVQFSKEQKQERKERNIARSAEYEAVQAAYRRGGYEAVDECLRLKPWTAQKAVK
jgi:hypothetical protein